MAKKFGLKTLNALVNRRLLASLAGLQYGGERNLYTIFGYKEALTSEDFLAKYIRQDIASRVVDAPPGATWSNPPTMKDNEALQEEWNELESSIKLFQSLWRADRLARMNPFSLVLFGFDDTGSLKRPVNNTGVNELLYARAIGSRQVDEVSFNDDIRSPRFGMPELYKIKFDDPATKSATAGTVTVKGMKEVTVHHSRIVHVVENPLEDSVFGTPIMEKVYNLLDDLIKVAGGTAEMFWLSGRGGMQADIDKDLDIDPADAAALGEELDEWMHQQRRFIRTRGVKLNTLDHAVPSPKEIFELIMALISGTTGIPRRILLGSEAGQLASEQDRANWAERITERRALFATPGILEPTTGLLQQVGLLSEGDIEWVWPSAFIQNPLEEGQTKAQTARAVGNLSRQTGNQKPMQLTSREEARGILGLEGDLDEKDLLSQLSEKDEEQFKRDDKADAEGGDEDGDDPTGENIRAKIRDEDADE